LFSVVSLFSNFHFNLLPSERQGDGTWHLAVHLVDATFQVLVAPVHLAHPLGTWMRFLACLQSASAPARQPPLPPILHPEQQQFILGWPGQ